MERTPTVEQLKYLVVPKIAAHWKVVGEKLQLSTRDLHCINIEFRHSSECNCCNAMLRYWKRTTNATADQLIDAIEDSGNGFTASKLRLGWPYEYIN